MHEDGPDLSNRNTPISNFSLCDVYSVLSRSHSQDQYVFIHDAVLESLTCGDTQIPASGLSSAIKKLKLAGKTEDTVPCNSYTHVLCTQSASV